MLERLSFEQVSESLRWGRLYLHPSAILKPGPFTVFLEIQSRISGAVLITLALFVFPVWTALLVMLSWGFFITWVYESARRNGLPDLMVTEQEGPLPLSYSFNFLKVYLLGWPQYFYAKFASRQLSKPERSIWSKVANYLICAGVFGGVTSVHHTLREMGCSECLVFWGNMAGRVIALPGRGVQVYAWVYSLQHLGALLGLGDLNDYQLKNIGELV